jgi:hypothetical protein
VIAQRLTSDTGVVRRPAAGRGVAAVPAGGAE